MVWLFVYMEEKKSSQECVKTYLGNEIIITSLTKDSNVFNTGMKKAAKNLHNKNK